MYMYMYALGVHRCSKIMSKALKFSGFLYVHAVCTCSYMYENKTIYVVPQVINSDSTEVIKNFSLPKEKKNGSYIYVSDAGSSNHII